MNEPLDSPTMTIATWPGGYTLERLMAEDAQGKELPVVRWEDPHFAVKHNGVSIYWFRFSSRDKSPWLVKVAHPAPEHRRVLISAFIEVLHGALPSADTSRSYQREHSGIIAPIIIDGHELGRLLGAPFGSELELLKISEILAEVHDAQMQVPIGPLDGGIMNREKLSILRRNYQHVAAQIIRELKLGRLSRIMNLSTPGLWSERTRGDAPFEHTSAQPMDGWWIVLALSLLPRPSWDVFFQKKPEDWRDYGGCGGVHFNTERIYLAKDAPGPVTALLRADLIRSSGRTEEEAWIDSILADAPEPEPVFDMEAYLLLDAKLPILLKTPRFLEWVAEMRGEKFNAAELGW